MTLEEARKTIILGYCTNPSPKCHGLCEVYPACGNTEYSCYQALRRMDEAFNRVQKERSDEE